MTLNRILLLVLILGLAGAFLLLDLGQYLSLDYLKQERDALTQAVADNPWQAAGLYFLIYVAVTALSLPGAAVMTLAGGAIFGLLWGTVLVSFASTLGATLAMLVARFVLGESVQRRFNRQLESINRGIEKDGAFYLFTLRLVPIFPFFVINLLMGLTRMKVLTFLVISQIGMFPATVVYVNAGTQLAQIDSLGGILSANVLLSFTLLGLFPLIAKKLVDWLKSRRMLSRYEKPKQFDRDLVVIGAGSGGLVAALIAATVRARVTLIEQHKMGGDCLNTGCVPSKALIKSARMVADAHRARDFGLGHMQVDYEFADVMARVKQVIKTIEPHDSVERYESLGVDVEIGRGKILSPYHVEVNGKILTTRNIIIATGAAPLVPPIEGLDQVGYLTSDTLWEITELPGRLVVLGGGPIGTELAQSFQRLGSEVTQVEMAPRILIREDPEFSTMVQEAMEGDGASVMTGHLAKRVEVRDGEKVLITESEGQEHQIPFDQLLVAVGRKANVTGFGLEELEVAITNRGTVEVNDFLQTNFPNIFAIGDVAGPYQFTHTASHMAWYAAVNALFGTFKKFRVDYSVIPWSTFCYPEVARVGINQTEAEEAGIDHEVTTYDVKGLDRAIADAEAHGLVKVITAKGSDKILGVTIAAEHAGDLIAEYVLAMKHGLGLGKIMGTIHIYPTLAEMNKFAASEWRKAHKPDWLLDWVERYHNWRRGDAIGAPLSNEEG